MHEAIEPHRDLQENRERVLQDAENAWNEYQAAGLHVTAEEADGWLEHLEHGEDREPPRPHQ